MNISDFITEFLGVFVIFGSPAKYYGFYLLYGIFIALTGIEILPFFRLFYGVAETYEPFPFVEEFTSIVYFLENAVVVFLGT